MTPGRALYLGVHAPRAALARCVRAGGPLEQWRDRRAATAMRLAAWNLPAVEEPEAPPLEVHQVTGRAYLESSAFCLWSLARAARRGVAPVFYDDGSLLPESANQLRALFPRARFVFEDEFQERLDGHLPRAQFPVLRERLEVYPHLRKLVAPHLGRRGWKLVLDADLLFFQRPEFLLHWLKEPSAPLHLREATEAYGYPRPLLERLAGTAVPERVNVGLCGLRSEALDWERLEGWCDALLATCGSHYLLEQALTALLLSGEEPVTAPEADYVTLPSEDEVHTPRAVMHHYVAESKRWYFRLGWRHLLPGETSPVP